MTRFLLILILVIPTLTFGQKCVAVKDPFTNKSNVLFYRGRSNTNIMYSYSPSNDSIKLNLTFDFKGDIKGALINDFTIQFKFEDGEVLTLTAYNKITPIVKANEYAVFTSYYTQYYLTKNQIKSLSSKKVIFFKQTNPTKDDLTFDLSKRRNNKYWKNFSEGAKCIYDSLNN